MPASEPYVNASDKHFARVPDADRALVRLHAREYMNMAPGGRPSDFARMAVNEYLRDPVVFRAQILDCERS